MRNKGRRVSAGNLVLEEDILIPQKRKGTKVIFYSR
jgi:hypothetical protein